MQIFIISSLKNNICSRWCKTFDTCLLSHCSIILIVQFNNETIQTIAFEQLFVPAYTVQILIRQRLRSRIKIEMMYTTYHVWFDYSICFSPRLFIDFLITICVYLDQTPRCLLIIARCYYHAWIVADVTRIIWSEAQNEKKTEWMVHRLQLHLFTEIY